MELVKQCTNMGHLYKFTKIITKLPKSLMQCTVPRDTFHNHLTAIDYCNSTCVY